MASSRTAHARTSILGIMNIVDILERLYRVSSLAGYRCFVGFNHGVIRCCIVEDSFVYRRICRDTMYYNMLSIEDHPPSSWADSLPAALIAELQNYKSMKLKVGFVTPVRESQLFMFTAKEVYAAGMVGECDSLHVRLVRNIKDAGLSHPFLRSLKNIKVHVFTDT